MIWPLVFRGRFPSGVGSTPAGRVAAPLLSLLAILVLAAPAAARVLEVGPTRAMIMPSQAAAAAADGDVVIIDPGVYQDCAVFTASGLTVQARPLTPSAKPTIMSRPVITGPPCADRGLFLFFGNNVTVRGLTFAGARDSSHNGAGILMEGTNLTVEDSQFLNNEDGILTGGGAESVVHVSGSLFRGNGSCEGACAHALYVGRRIGRLEVVNSVFIDTHVGHSIKSRALKTVITGNRIEDGVNGTSSYLIELPEGGDAVIEDNVFQKGAQSQNKDAAISIGVPGKLARAGMLVVKGNSFVSDLPEPVVFVRNDSTAEVTLTHNRLAGRVTPLAGPGTVE